MAGELEQAHEASERVRAFTERWAKPPLGTFELSVLGSEAHRAVVERIPE